MLKVNCDSSNRTACNEPKVTDLIINGREDTEFQSQRYVETDRMGHKGHYQKALSKNNETQDLRTQSLPNCVVNKNKCEDVDTVDFCDIHNSLLVENSSSANVPWFNTWPERYDKVKTNDGTLSNTPVKLQNCDIVENGGKNKVSLSEALQNISLAYSPITKQLHLVEKPYNTVETDGCKSLVNGYDDCGADQQHEKKGHKRNQMGSFSSTISSISEPSTSNSLLDADEKSLNSFDDCQHEGRIRGFTNFFSRNVFSSWRAGSHSSASVWKFFSKNVKDGSSTSPHRVASSSALIQHPRPSNLPAKDQEEEQRHREEYKLMVLAAKRKEAQNLVVRLKLQKLQLQQEELQAASTKHFIKHVLPNWEQMHMNKKTRDLWWQGLPSSVRGKVWRLAIGNDLNLTPQLYEICVSRAQDHLNTPSRSSGTRCDQESSLDVIRLDISRTFPHLGIFQEGGPYSDVLHSLVAAYVCYRPDVGYVQGMSYIAAILILNMEAFDAFICFANLLNQPLHLSAFTLNQEQMEAYYSAYDEVFCHNLPKLHQHFETAKLTPDLYLLDWIYTVFAKAMPLDVACRVWDVFLRDGCEFIFRTALGILHLNQDTLINMDFLHGAQFLTHLPDDLCSDQLFKSIQSITTKIGTQTFCQIVEKYSGSFR